MVAAHSFLTRFAGEKLIDCRVEIGGRRWSVLKLPWIRVSSPARQARQTPVTIEGRWKNRRARKVNGEKLVGLWSI